MKIKPTTATFFLGAALLVAGPAMAMDMNMNHGGGNDHAAMQSATTQLPGQEIHTSMAKGYQLSYRLIDMKEKMAAMADHTAMPAEMKSHHLMVFVKDGGGRPITDARVGYLVSGPDGSSQKAMTMAMSGGYGADVDFKVKGSYTVKTKIMVAGKPLMDSFQYEAK